jgi:hypothetical protein
MDTLNDVQERDLALVERLREGLDAGVPVVLAVETPDAWPVGRRVAFDAAPPIHAFVLPPDRRPDRPDEGGSIDEAH